MNPVGIELDASVLRILGWRLVTFEQGSSAWKKPDGKFHEFAPVLSADPNGHEALRLCGPWLDEHASWSYFTYDGKHFCDSLMGEHFIETSGATRAEAICRLVEAVHERETLNPPRAT